MASLKQKLKKMIYGTPYITNINMIPKFINNINNFYFVEILQQLY